MSFNRSIRHHTLLAETLLPFFDSIFGAVLTLLVFDVPSMLDMSGQYQKLFTPILIYCLTGLIVVLYWFRLRRLIGIAHFLHVPQLLCLGQAVLAICLFPKLSNLVLLYGSERGSIFELTQGQIVNTAYLTALFLFNALCLFFAWSLTTRHSYGKFNGRILRRVIGSQLLGFGFLLAMLGAVIFSEGFNNQYIYLVPIVIIAEEVLVAAQFSSLRS